MPTGLPARVLLVCTVLCGAIAHAERRPVAVIDLSGERPTADLARDLNPVLLGHPDLQPIPDPSIVPELFGEFRDDDRDHLMNAQNAKQTAEQRLAGFDFPIAEENAKNGQAELEQADPTAQSLLLYAQITFLCGQAQLGIRGKASQARESFALAHRIDPGFVPDAARYLPDVVQAFTAAKLHWSGVGRLEIAGTGRVWVDGKDAGLAPTELDVPAGPHTVWLTGGDRETKAGRVVVEAGRKVRLEIPAAPASERLKVRRARAALRYAPDPAARAAAMRQIAELVGVKDAVLLSSANNKIIVQTWNAGTRDQAPGFSALREMKNEKPIDLLAPLAPPRPTQVDDPPPPRQKPLVDDRRWYEKRPYQAGMVAAVVAAIIGGYYLYHALTDDTVTADPNFSPAARVRF